jgi:hypothetical protein
MQRHDVRELLVEGMDVYGADGGKVGSIVALTPLHLVVEKGFFFPTDHDIPLTAVSRVDIDGVWLNVPKAAALRHHWDQAQRAEETDIVLTAPIMRNDGDRTAGRSDADGSGPPASNVEPIRRYSTDNTQDAPPRESTPDDAAGEAR